MIINFWRKIVMVTQKLTPFNDKLQIDGKQITINVEYSLFSSDYPYKAGSHLRRENSIGYIFGLTLCPKGVFCRPHHCDR